MELISVMEWVAVVLTIAMFSTGLPPCMNMYKTGSTENIPYMAFLLCTVSCFTMTHYGLLVSNSIIVFINIVGTVMQAFYVGLYLLVTRSKFQPVVYIGAAITYIAALYAYLYTVIIDTENIAQILGSSSGIITAILISLPGLQLIDNIRHKNANGTPVVMLWGSIICCLAWLIYGLMLDDANIYAPNIPGIVVTTVKLVLVACYGSSEKEKTS